ncbi:MotE family protein [Roseovarius salinarum]|uniref:MotE family protein n=1 Tax=Roseovarius salinarum TaxID=1981892 RepID=UPI000C344909|nr:hypothetical protein [Roseovarius salinarum]
MIRRRATSGRPGPPGRGTLVTVGLLLVGSAVLRIGHDAGQAFAQETATGPQTGETRANGPEACETPDDMRALLEAFEARETRLETREAELRDRMQALRVADREVSRKLAALEAAEAELRDTIALAESASADDLDRLTKVYENMKPKQAAALFEEMDPAFAAGFLGRMRPDAAAEIMAGLSPAAAHSFSVVLAGRNANVPRE